MITVVITCHNYEEYLSEALASIEDAKVIVIHDGCDKPSDGDVIIKETIGTVRAKNLGVYLAQTEYVMCLDADDFLSARYIQVLSTRTFPRVCLTTAVKEFGDFEKSWIHDNLSLEDFIAGNRAHGASLFPKQAWIDVGGFPNIAYEDWGFWIKILRAGYTFQVVEGVHLNHRRHGRTRDVINNENYEFNKAEATK